MESKLSYEEYSKWCKARFPGTKKESCAASLSKTVPAAADTEEPCPVTIRCPTSDQAVITPRRSR